MFYADTSRLGVPFAKDPSVIEFKGRYLMYYSLPPAKSAQAKAAGEPGGWGIGIAESHDLLHWKRVGELTPEQPVESNGIAAPGARVIDGVVHLFYQTYGHGAHDAICHATSRDGVHFEHDPTNPIYHPTAMPWSVGRAIDAEVFVDTGRILLYFATRDPQMRRQMIGLASAPRHSRLGAGDWTDLSKQAPLLQPELPWEGLCIEAPSVLKHGKTYFLFYAGAYNNVPQQIGVARSPDGLHWTRVSDQPLLPNGVPGTWNSSESGHPGVFATNGRTFLFYQGNDNKGRTYHLSMVELGWHGDTPYVLSSHRPAPVRAGKGV